MKQKQKDKPSCLIDYNFTVKDKLGRRRVIDSMKSQCYFLVLNEKGYICMMDKNEKKRVLAESIKEEDKNEFSLALITFSACPLLDKKNKGLKR